MRLVLHGLSALPVLLTSYELDRRRQGDQKILHNCQPNPRAIAHFEQLFPQVPAPYSFTASDWRPAKDSYRVFSSAYPYPAGSFCQVANGIYAASPELCFVQLGNRVSPLELILYGSALCSIFVIDPAAHGGLTQRRPLTTKRRIARFIDRNPRLTGISHARKALPYLVENAASPPEVFLQMALTLPPFLGGFGLPGCRANYRIALSARSQTIARRKALIPDCCWPQQRLAVEYDSNAEHLTSHQITLDATKRLSLEAEGYKVISVTAEQLVDRGHMGNLATEIARHTGFRLRIRHQHFLARQAELFRRGWSLDPVFDLSWLHPPQREVSEGRFSENGTSEV